MVNNKKPRKCPRCGVKDAKEFWQSKTTGRFQVYCKPCNSFYREKWRIANLAKDREYKRNYYHAQKKKLTLKQYVKQAIKAALTVQVNANNRRALEDYKQKGKITTSEWYSLIKEHSVCPGCSSAWSFVGKPTLDHIRPLVRGGKNVIENIQPLCMACNMRKKLRVKKFLNKSKEVKND